MRIMADLIRQGRYTDEIMQVPAALGTRHGARGSRCQLFYSDLKRKEK